MRRRCHDRIQPPPANGLSPGLQPPTNRPRRRANLVAAASRSSSRRRRTYTTPCVGAIPSVDAALFKGVSRRRPVYSQLSLVKRRWRQREPIDPGLNGSRRRSGRLRIGDTERPAPPPICRPTELYHRDAARIDVDDHRDAARIDVDDHRDAARIDLDDQRDAARIDQDELYHRDAARIDRDELYHRDAARIT